MRPKGQAWPSSSLATGLGLRIRRRPGLDLKESAWERVGKTRGCLLLKEEKEPGVCLQTCPSQRTSGATFALLKFQQSRWSLPPAHLLPTPQLPVTSHLALEEQGEREMIFIGALVTMARSVVPRVVGGTVRGG